TSKVVAPPAHPTTQEISTSRRRHYLFGYPISHSASPAFQNSIWQFLESQPSSSSSSKGTVPTYSLCETKSIEEAHLYSLVRHDPRHGGSGVTMPLKVAVASKLGRDQILDELDSIGQATLTVNTIVVRPSLTGDTSLSQRRMVGTNTDCLGIRHAVLRDIAQQNGAPAGSLIGSTPTAGPYVFPLSQEGQSSKPFSAFIIGSGGTCRSAVWALHNLGLSPLYLLNRDEQETKDVVQHFSSMDIDLRPLHSVEAFAYERALRDEGKIGQIACAVGAIPAFEPVTPSEKMVYTLAHAFFQEPYQAKQLASQTASIPTAGPSSSVPLRVISLPNKRPFLDMCYKPRLTPLLKYASTQTNTWSAIGGVEAMVEQGLAQARMWAASSQILDGTASDLKQDPLSCSTKTGDDGPLGLECEEQARKMAQNMSDI
ncbi:uncharacterized protein FA14DRAFT_105396, partial [Meira miltonrushii]